MITRQYVAFATILLLALGSSTLYADGNASVKICHIPPGDTANFQTITINEGAFMAIGIFGQMVYVNPTQNVVIAIWSARSKPLDSTPVSDADFFAAVCRAMTGEY